MQSAPFTLSAAQPDPAEGEKFQLGYKPALDGLRGVAILAVVATHTRLVNGWAGEVGVDIFFVLSGFLITSLLIEERDKFHSINLRKFYARRALRLLPALVVLIIALVTWHWLMNPRDVARRTSSDGLIALFYATNWMFALGFREPAHVFAHTWTLSIEEQFYLWWPIILILLLRRCSSRASLLRWVILGIFALLVEKLMVAAGIPVAADRWLNYATEARADTLLIGCLAGIVLSSKLICSEGKLRDWLVRSAWYIGVPGLILIGYAADFSADFSAVGLHTTIGLFAFLILMEVIVSENGMLAWLLSRRWLVGIGKVSYGLYLWHYPIFTEVQSRNWPLQYELAVEIGLTACATIASFYLVERPALKLKKRFSLEKQISVVGLKTNTMLPKPK